MKVPFSYLKEKFANPEAAISGIRKLLERGDFTLGEAVTEFENKFAALIGVKHAIGVANGTDAIRISLKLAGVEPGDEVITGAHSFIASAGAIVELGAKPVFVDMNPRTFTLDVRSLESRIHSGTKAILPVHFTGQPAEMERVMEIARAYSIPVIEDAAQAVLAEYRGKKCGTIGKAGCFSLHPLKNLNVWGDGGFITTNDNDFAARIRLYRNHGLVDRDHIASFGCNSRLDTLQALVGLTLIDQVEETTMIRRKNAAIYDSELEGVPGVELADRHSYSKSCFHLYMFSVPYHKRDKLIEFLNENGVEAKVHYPIPMYRQRAFGIMVKQEFPKTDAMCKQIVTLPVHEHLSENQLQYAIDKVKEFMCKT